jgi:hypothetical protein
MSDQAIPVSEAGTTVRNPRQERPQVRTLRRAPTASVAVNLHDIAPGSWAAMSWVTTPGLVAIRSAGKRPRPCGAVGENLDKGLFEHLRTGSGRQQAIKGFRSESVRYAGVEDAGGDAHAPFEAGSTSWSGPCSRSV